MEKAWPTHPTIDDATLFATLFDVFRSHGSEGTSLSVLSQATGLKKSSLYHRFPQGKEGMLNTVVNYVVEQIHHHLIGPLSDQNESPEKRFNTGGD